MNYLSRQSVLSSKTQQQEGDDGKVGEESIPSSSKSPSAQKSVQEPSSDFPIPPIEFVFVNAPLLTNGTLSYQNLPTSGSMTTSVKEDEFEAAERTWFHEQGTEMESKDPGKYICLMVTHSTYLAFFHLIPLPKPTMRSPARLAGLDASLQWLTQLWNSTLHSSPYNGILSFSAGSALSAMLPLIRTPHLQFHGLSFMILISGYIPTPPPDAGFGGVRREDHYGVDVVNVPTLHVVGAANEVVRPEESLEISRR